MIALNKNQDLRLQCGISLSIVGVVFGMYLNYFIPIIHWSPIIMIVSIILICKPSNIYFLRFDRIPLILKGVIGFQIIMLLYGFISNGGTMTNQYMFFHFYVIALCISYSFASSKLLLDKLPTCLFFLSFITSVLGAFLSYKELVVGMEVWQMKQENENYALEPFTVAIGALINLFCAYVMSKSSKLMKILFVIAVVLDIYILFDTGKRTPIFIAIVGTLFFLWKKKWFSLANFKKTLVYIPLFLLGFTIAYFSIGEFQIQVANFTENFYKGVLNLFGNTTVSDSTGSAVQRWEARNFMYDYIDNHFSFIEYIFGAGYLIRSLDAPLLEAYLDMGILGFIGYISIVIFYPLKQMLRDQMDDKLLLALMISLYPIFSCINSGNPYQYNKYTAVCMIAYMIYYNKRNKII